VEVVTSEDRFWVACPCAADILRYVAGLLESQSCRWGFGKAIIRPWHTSAMFVCVGPDDDAQELWVSATADRLEGWTLQHTQLAPWGQ
jgi:hypothetical protein